MWLERAGSSCRGCVRLLVCRTQEHFQCPGAPSNHVMILSHEKAQDAPCPLLKFYFHIKEAWFSSFPFSFVVLKINTIGHLLMSKVGCLYILLLELWAQKQDTNTNNFSIAYISPSNSNHVKNIAENNVFVMHIFHNEENVILYVHSRVYSGSRNVLSSFKVPFLFVKKCIKQLEWHFHWFCLFMITF